MLNNALDQQDFLGYFKIVNMISLSSLKYSDHHCLTLVFLQVGLCTLLSCSSASIFIVLLLHPPILFLLSILHNLYCLTATGVTRGLLNFLL